MPVLLYLRPETVNRVWPLDLTTVDLLFVRFYVVAVVDGFSRKLLALRVYKDAPASRNMIALVKNTVKRFGTPRFIVTDHGCQFRTEFKRFLKKLKIDLVKGCKDRSKQFNGKCERFFKTFKLWQRLTVLFAGKDHIQRKLDIFREWYNVKRPMWLHGGRTPEEVWSNTALPEAQSFLARDRVQPVFHVQRVDFKRDRNLPTVFVDSA
jgi:transposase InsO family protein